MKRRFTRGAVLVALGTLIAASLTFQPAPAAQLAGSPPPPPERVETASDPGQAKLHPRLKQRVDNGDTDKVHVFATVVGDAAPARALLDGARVAQSGGTGIVLGAIGVSALPKLASAKGVVSVQPIDLRRTGQPLGDPDGPRQLPTKAERSAALDRVRNAEVPHSQAPAPRGSNFEQMRRQKPVLDAKTHNFHGAWKDGYTGTGVTVGVLDGGTDWGHPDLLNTWQTWSGQTGPRAGWNGWPKTFDPYGTLQWLAAPGQVDLGLSWYVKTAAATCAQTPTCAVPFATRTGPSRNFNVPSGTKQHTYSFPAAYSKSGKVRLGSHPDDHLLSLYEERPAFLVTDPNQAGVYDTIFVDLDNDYQFGDEKPVSKASPASYRDMNGDGYTDLSGGLAYYISDGATPVPGGLDAFGVLDTSFGPGELVAWNGDYDPQIGGHGTLCASNIVGQAVINGKAPVFKDLPGGTYPGAVLGGAPHAKLAPFGDIYFSFEFSTQFGYFLSTRRGVDITSNSYGDSTADHDGWDAASQEADVIHAGRSTTGISSTGNGAPGFGTVTGPSPSSWISVGASTQQGGTGWDSILRTTQMVENDVVVWSNRGFGSNATNGVDVVANGSRSSGDITLNTVLDGQTAWATWGGTSRSTPVAAGATALVYQAWRDRTGAIPAGFYDTAKEILQSSAKDLGYEASIQGSGSVDAGKAVEVAAGDRGKVSPSSWRVGDYRGKEYPVFAHVTAPGGTDRQRFTVDKPGVWRVSDRQLVRTDSETFDFSSSDVAKESGWNFNAPDYLVDLTKRVRRHRGADLMVIRVSYPRAQFDRDGNYQEDQAWRLLPYSWTDVNHDGRLWRDRDGDGAVDHADLPTGTNIDNHPNIDFAKSEMQRGEYNRFMYHRATSNALTGFVRDPYQRMGDGLFLGLQHSVRNNAIPVTNFTVRIDWYENSDWKWLETPRFAYQGFDATVRVPAKAPYGMYSGAVVLTRGRDSMVVPVSVAVAAKVAQDAAGKITGALDFGGTKVAQAQSHLLYNNGSVFGATDWGWRPESGDWRHFFLDVPQKPADGSLLLANTSWQGTAPSTDIDTLIMGRSANHFQVVPDAVFGGPYMLGPVGRSPNTNIRAGVWRFDTASGGADDLVTAPAQEGLHALALHQVGWHGNAFNTPFSVRLGGAAVSPSAVVQEVGADSGSFPVTFESSVDLAGLRARAFGLSQPSVTTETAQQDDPDDPSSASVKKNVTVRNASRLKVSTALDRDDLDLFVVFDANKDGTFGADEVVASSATAASNESIELVGPADGEYQVWVQGFAVAGTPEFTLTVDAVQGTDLTVTGEPTGAVPAGTPVTLNVQFAKQMTAGQQYHGELLLGPPTAPSALTVPITIKRM